MRLVPRRRYMPHRRAYWPRTWPMVLGGAVPVWLICAGLRLPPVLGAVTGATVGALVGNVRIWAWKRRHPVISTQQYINDLRKQARWN